MENQANKWKFRGNEELTAASALSLRGVLDLLNEQLDEDDRRVVVPLGHGDPSVFPSFRTAHFAEAAVVDALCSAKFNCYASAGGILTARRAIADYLSGDLPHKISPGDVYITNGGTQAIEVLLTILARPGANILLPRPGYPDYDARAASCNLGVRCYDLLPDKGWEVDLHGVEDMADENTVAMVIINPGNPCGNVFSYQHLKKIADTARKLGIMVIADEVYEHLTFASTPFVPMGVFGSFVPILTIGSLSKRWVVPGWRLGWIVTIDPSGFLKDSGVVESIIGFLNMSADPTTFVQGSLPRILERTNDDFFTNITSVLKDTADICYENIQKIPCLTCPNKPEGAMFAMVKLNVSMMEGIKDDLEFCKNLAKEESVIVLPGVAIGMKNWLRITFAIEPSFLKDGLGRIKAFCERHAKQQL